VGAQFVVMTIGSETDCPPQVTAMVPVPGFVLVPITQDQEMTPRSGVQLLELRPCFWQTIDPAILSSLPPVFSEQRQALGAIREG
jgi:hypothetical protein